jgi:cytochrome c-type biogenesis protein CcmH/NrfG
VVALAVGVRPFWADHLAHDGQVAQATPNVTPTDVAGVYLHASRFERLEPSYPSLAGAVYEAQGNNATDGATRAQWFGLALAQYRRSLRIQPDNVFYMMNVARVYTSWASADPSRYPVADNWWRQAVDQDPTDWQVHNQYALMLGAWAQAEPADATLESRTAGELQTVVRIRPDQVTTWINLVKVYRSLGDTTQAKAALTTALSLDPKNAEAKSLAATGTLAPAPGSGA